MPLLTTFALLALACGGRQQTETPSPTSPAPQSAASAKSPPRAQVDLGAVLGVNEAVAIPPMILMRDRPSPEQIGQELEKDARLTQELGAHWVRTNSGGFPFLHHQHWQQNRRVAQAQADQWVRTVQAHGLEPLMMVSPWPGTYTHRATDSYPPPDMAAYTAWVKEVVERYDGDGIDDMPGLKSGVHHWEVDNEPDLKNDGPPPQAKIKAPENFCEPPQYAEVLVATSAAIREADAQAVVLGGGFYRPQTEGGCDYMRAVFGQPGTVEAIDALSLHVYATDPDTRRLEKALANAKEVLPGKPIWITETNQPSVSEKKGEEYVSPKWQASMMVEMLGVSLREGVQTFFWHTLADAPPGKMKQPGMKHHSFYEQPGGELVAKPIVGTWRRLAERFEALGRVEVVPGEGSIRLGTDGPTLLWEGTASGTATDLVTGEVTTGKVTAGDGAVYWVE